MFTHSATCPVGTCCDRVFRRFIKILRIGILEAFEISKTPIGVVSFSTPCSIQHNSRNSAKTRQTLPDVWSRQVPRTAGRARAPQGARGGAESWPRKRHLAPPYRQREALDARRPYRRAPVRPAYPQREVEPNRQRRACDGEPTRQSLDPDGPFALKCPFLACFPPR